MKFPFIINAPGQAHTRKNVSGKLPHREHAVKIVVRDYYYTPVVTSDFIYNFPKGTTGIRGLN